MDQYKAELSDHPDMKTTIALSRLISQQCSHKQASQRLVFSGTFIRGAKREFTYRDAGAAACADKL